MIAYLPSLPGGLLIGLSTTMLLLLNGRIASIAGIVGRLTQGTGVATNAAFIAGLVLSPLAYRVAAAIRPPRPSPCPGLCWRSQGCSSGSVHAWARVAPAVTSYSVLRVCRRDL
jgi:hypothetical protein